MASRDHAPSPAVTPFLRGSRIDHQYVLNDHAMPHGIGAVRRPLRTITIWNDNHYMFDFDEVLASAASRPTCSDDLVAG